MKTDGSSPSAPASSRGAVQPVSATAPRWPRSGYWQRRGIRALTLTAAIAPWLLIGQNAADAAPAVVAPEPVRAAGAIVGPAIVRVGAGNARTSPSTIDPRVPTGLELTANSRLTLSESARSDLVSGSVDSRLVRALVRALGKHRLEVSTITTGHAKFVRGTNRVSNHIFGRALDITTVDGIAVSADSASARALMDELFAYPDAIRPTEVGGPWDLDGVDGAGFTDGGHASHIHMGFDA